MNSNLNRKQVTVITIFAAAIIVVALFFLGTIQRRGFYRLKNNAILKPPPHTAVK